MPSRSAPAAAAATAIRSERPAEEVAEDVRQGYVGAQAAAELYGVVVDAETFVVDMTATGRLRAAGRKANSVSA